MKPLVIDAPLIKAYFQEDQDAGKSSCTALVSPIIKSLGRSAVAFIDDEKKIEAEWMAPVEREWFVAWFTAGIDAGAIEFVSMRPRADLIKLLEVKFGFPRGSGDRWYLFVCSQLVHTSGDTVTLLSEDLDFFDPTEKRCKSKRRLEILESGDGPVARYLRKKESIDVRAACSHEG